MESSEHPKLEIYLCRHGETEWALSGRHTSVTDIGLTKNGIHQALLLRKRIAKIPWSKILSSPKKRALETCQMMHLEAKPIIDSRLQEWDYGKYEGKTSEEIEQSHSDWNIFLKGAPGGESPGQVSDRADDFIASVKKEMRGHILLFSHGHFLRVLAVRWLGLPVADGRLFALNVGSLSALGYERNLPVIKLWNDTTHLG